MPLPVTGDGRVYVISTGQKAAALDMTTGTPLWEKDPPGSGPPDAGTQRQTVVLWPSQNDLYRLNADTGALLDRVDTGDWIEAGPILAGDMLLLAGKDGAVLA